MFILRIEHPVPDFDAWKREGFDNDPLNRQQSAVQYYRIMRPVDNPNYALIDLGFAKRDQAEAMLERLKTMWSNVQERFGWTKPPKATIVEVTQEEEY